MSDTHPFAQRPLSVGTDRTLEKLSGLLSAPWKELRSTVHETVWLGAIREVRVMLWACGLGGRCTPGGGELAEPRWSGAQCSNVSCKQGGVCF